MAAITTQAQDERPISFASVASWILYDLANTIFSLNIASLYFPLWVVNAMGGTDQQFGNATALSMALMFVSAPIIGALSDQSPRRLPFLIVSTLLAVTFTLLLGTGGLALSLVFFIAANYFYQAGLIFYDALLPEVSTEATRGRVGGLGVGLGYFGSFIGIGAGLLLLERLNLGYESVFRATGLLYLVFALPIFLFLKERPRKVRPFGLHAVGRAFAEIRTTLSRTSHYPGLGRFLFGRIFYADAANTVIAFMGIYVTNELGFTSGQAQIVLLLGIVGAIAGGLIGGFIVDHIGPKKTLNVFLIMWMTVFALAFAIPTFGLPSALFWAVGVCAGFALGGTWSADRPYMLRLSPPRYVGQFYGLYAMVGRFAAILGPFLWGFIVNTLNLGRPAAILSLLVMTAISFVILQGVSDARRPWGPEDLPEPA